jgi:hypothetical protein
VSQRQQVRVLEWNNRVTVGAEVIVRKDDGTEVPTTTASAAFMLGGHTACIMLDGISGCYALDRVRVR